MGIIKESVDVAYTQKRSNGEIITRRISDVNCGTSATASLNAASDANVAQAVTALADLSENTLTSITKEWHQELQIANPNDIYAPKGVPLNINNTKSNIAIFGSAATDAKGEYDMNNTASGAATNDSIVNSGNYVSIYSAAGTDTISNSGTNCYIDTRGASLTAQSTGADATLSNEGDYAQITLKGYASYLNNTGDNVSVKTYTGSYYAGSSSITNTGDNFLISNLSNATVNNSGNNCSLTALVDTTYVTDTGVSSYIEFSSSSNITAAGDNASLVGKSYSGTSSMNIKALNFAKIYNSGDNFYINLYSGKPIIRNTGSNGTILYGGAKSNDLKVYNDGDNVTITTASETFGSISVFSTGDDNHYYLGKNSTIPAAQRNYLVSITGGTHQTIHVPKGNNRKCSISGFNLDTDLIQIEHSSIPAGDSISHSISDGQASVYISNGEYADNCSLVFTDISSGSLRVQYDDGEVTLYNLG